MWQEPKGYKRGREQEQQKRKRGYGCDEKTREKGKKMYRKNTWLTAVYHPSAILRDPSKMEETKKDFEKIWEKFKELGQE